MSQPETNNSDVKNSLVARRKAINLKPLNISKESLVKTDLLQPEKSLPLVVHPLMKGVNLTAWAAANRQFIEGKLLEHGGLLFRGFAIKDAPEYEQFIKAISGELLEYQERSSPRSRIAGNIYTSTDYPASQSIFVHNENSYQRTFPLKIFFFCHTPAQSGGETPIADCRRVFQRIGRQIRNRFEEKGWMYVRNFGDGFGLSWQTAFQTNCKSVVEDHCRRNGILVEWKSGDRLRTRSILPAVEKHPRTGERVWFNHATFFSVTTLESSLREALLADFGPEELPTNTFYGDGTPIEPEALESLREAYMLETVTFPWQRGDVLLLDNMLVAHGRAPYEGHRKILVGMAEPFTRTHV